MKKSIILLFVLIGFLLVGCNNTEDVTLSASKSNLTLEIGDEEVILPKVNGTENNVKFKFESDCEDVVCVDEDGKITALKSGSAKITVTVEEYPKLKITINVKVNEEEIDPATQLTVTGPTTVIAGEEIQLTAVDKADTGHGVMWVALTASIAKVSQTGLVTGVKPGVAQFEVHSLENGTSKAFTIEVTEAAVSEVNISANINDTRIKTTANYKLSATVLPKAADQNVVWETSDDSIAAIGEDGFVTIVSYGEVTFTAKSIQDGTKKGTLKVEFYWDVMDLIDHLVVDKPIVQNVTAYGGTNYTTKVLGSVVNYFFGEYPFVRRMTPENSPNLPAITNVMNKEDVKFITIHDTGNTNVNAGAAMHATYMYNGSGGGQVSWHFSVGQEGVYQQVETNRPTWHAGDGSRKFGLNDTGVKATSKIRPTLGIDASGFYTLNGAKTIIQAPKDSNNNILKASAINDYGIYLEIGTNGNWYMNNSYYNTTYKLISNHGGNYNSVSMETCVDKGSDLYLTWHYTSKLTSHLLHEFDLGLERVTFHQNYSGKNCPQTMRMNGLIPNLLNMIEAEYLVEKFLGDYNLTLVSNNPDLVNNNGRIVKLPATTTQISFLITVENPSTGFVQTKNYYSTIPAN